MSLLGREEWLFHECGDIFCLSKAVVREVRICDSNCFCAIFCEQFRENVMCLSGSFNWRFLKQT